MTSEIEEAVARVKSWCGITTPKARTLWNEDLRTILSALTASQAEVERLRKGHDQLHLKVSRTLADLSGIM